METGAIENTRQEMLGLGEWYHNIDLGHGLITPGRSLDSLWNMDRRLMDQVDFKGKSVLDIGAMDGMWAFEAERRGAARVVTTDPNSWSAQRFAFCKRVLESRVEYYDVSVYDLSTALSVRLSEPIKFDIVICFGVLYHLRDPLLAIAQIRSVLRDDGTVLFETACLRSRKPLMYFNAGGNLFYDDPTTWWAPSYSCLESMCTASLLEARKPEPASAFELRGRFSKVGRTAFLASAVKGEGLSKGYRESIGDHYPPPLPRL